MNPRARAVAASWPHPWVGFYAEEFTGRPYHEADYVDPTWAPPDLPSILRYMRDTPGLAISGQGASCPFCGARVEPAFYHYDGAWLWPDDLAHDVERHAVVLPDRFVAHVRRLAYVPPAWDPDWEGRLPFP